MAKSSEIKFTIHLDEQHIPENITWFATDSEHREEKECKSVMISIWDPKEKNTLRIDLWTKEMRIDEMRTQFIETLLTLAESFGKATGHTFVEQEMRDFCTQFAKKTNEAEKKKGL